MPNLNKNAAAHAKAETLANKIIAIMQERGLSHDEMLQCLQMARFKVYVLRFLKKSKKVTKSHVQKEN